MEYETGKNFELIFNELEKIKKHIGLEDEKKAKKVVREE